MQSSVVKRLVSAGCPAFRPGTLTSPFQCRVSWVHRSSSGRQLRLSRVGHAIPDNTSPASSDTSNSSPSPAPVEPDQRQASGTVAAQTAVGASIDTQKPVHTRFNDVLVSRLHKAWHRLIAIVQTLYTWVQNQQLKALKTASDEDPLNADKHASYLHALNKVDPKAVLGRVDQKEYATNSAVAVEYIKALVLTGKVEDYATATPGTEEKTFTQLLHELEVQAVGRAVEENPGSSPRHPLHVNISGSAVAALARQSGPLQLVWTLFAGLVFLVVLAAAWLLGGQALRRMRSPNQPAMPTNVVSSQPPSQPNTEPKEYKKEELPETSVKHFKDVVGCDEAKEELKELVEFLKNPTRFTRLGAKLPKGVLLTGPPGTGKTLLAKAVAGEAGVPFFYRAGSEFEEVFVGVGSRRMRALFQAAKKKAPCIVFIDEIDAIGGNRKQWDNHGKKTLNQLLVEMDGFEANEGVIVMAATNLAESLDPALKRPGRFDRQVAVPLPDLRGREELFDYYLSDKPVAPDVDKDLLARQTQGFSGADISNVVNEAALTAAKEGLDNISAPLLDFAFDKIRMGVERKSVKRTEEGRKRTAYHESGHALVALSVPGASPIHKATIVPRGHALGMVTQVGREDEFSINAQQMAARILVCMGGQVAEELIFGKEQVTSGATDDLRQATELARHMVTQCGMNESVGPMYVADEKLLSEGFRQQIDGEVRRMLVEAREKVKTLLQDRIEDLHRLSEALLDRETLTLSEIQSILRGEKQAVDPSLRVGVLAPVVVSMSGSQSPSSCSATSS